MTERPIGMLYSGLGGLSILREIRRQLPDEDVVFFADQAHVPYGPRPLEQVRAFRLAIGRFLLDMEANVIDVACNPAPAAAPRHLREVIPQVPSGGVEPALRRAPGPSRARRVGVVATPATFQ